MDESVLAGQHFHERAEGGDGNNFAGVDLAHFDFLEHAIDHFLGAVETLLLGSVDVHGAVVLDVDLGAGLGLDTLDVLAARSDEFADAVGGDLQRNNARSVRAELGGCGDRFGHLVEDGAAGVLGDGDRFLEDRERQARELEVELVTGDALAGAAEFEVHVAVEVLGADDVEKALVLLHRVIVVPFGHKADGDAGDGADERDTGAEQRHRARANGGHRGRAVRFGDFRRNADRVGEILDGGDHRFDRALGKSAVADLAAVDATHAAGFADGEWREVVVEDETLLGFTARIVVHELLFIGRCERRDGEGLRFAAGENRRAVNAWQRAVFCVERAEVADLATVGTHAFLHDRDAERLLLKVFEGLLDIEVGRFRSTLLDRGFDFVAQGADFLRTLGFRWRVDGRLDAVAGDFVSDLEKVVLGEHRCEFTLRFAGELHELLLHLDELLHRLLRVVKGCHEFRFGKFVGLTFDHDDVGFVADIDQIKVAVFALLVGRVDHELSVDAADAHGADRAGEGDVGEAECGGGAVHREDVGVVFTIGAEQDGDDLRVVEITLREKRTQWAVRHAAGEDFLFSWATFALEVTTGENTGGGGLFFVFHGEREPGLAGLHLGGGNSGDQDDGVAAADGDGTVGEFGKFAGFDRHRIGSDIGRECMDVHFFLLSSIVLLSLPATRATGLPRGHGWVVTAAFRVRKNFASETDWVTRPAGSHLAS